MCFTGTLNAAIGGQPIARSVAEDLATKAGLIVSKGVSKKLDVLVVADPDTLSGKAQRARDLGTRIMAEAVFWQTIGASVDSSATQASHLRAAGSVPEITLFRKIRNA